MRRVEPVNPSATEGATKVAGRQSSPYTGKLSARPAGKPGGFSHRWRRVYDDAFLATTFRKCKEPYRAPSMRFLRHCGIYLVRCGWKDKNQNQTPGRDRAASRRSAPGPGSRTCREDHAPSHRPQMSSGRLFLDRVGRHQSPSPLHRRTQHNTHFPDGPEKGTFLLCWRG
jgi:hypothetical protein